MRPELLAPAGDLERLKVALLYGADAVYAGTTKLSLRTRTSMEFDDLVETVKLAHSLNKKCYVTMNIFPHNADFEGFENYVKYLEEIKVDAVIVSDFGIFKSSYKKLSLSGSLPQIIGQFAIP